MVNGSLWNWKHLDETKIFLMVAQGGYKFLFRDWEKTGGGGDLRLHAGKELLICSITSAKSELLLWESSSSSEQTQTQTQTHSYAHTHTHRLIFIYHRLWSDAICIQFAISKDWSIHTKTNDRSLYEVCKSFLSFSVSPGFSVSGPWSWMVGEETPFTLESTSGWQTERHTESRKHRRKLHY